MEADPTQDGRHSWSYVPRRRRILPEDAFFDDGNLEISLSHKQTPIEDEDEEASHTRYPDFKCHVIGCNLTFSTIQSYEIHYNGAHRNICRYCRRSYPSNHLLDIHILESHDSFFEVMAQKQPMYQCLVESCSEKFPDAQNRREHLIKCHHYPADFRFQKGISRPRCKEKPKQSLNSAEDAMDTAAPCAPHDDTHPAIHGDTHPVTHSDTHPATQGGIPGTTCIGQRQDLEHKQHRVPVNITFGRGGTRSFQRGPQKHQNKQKKNKGHAHKTKGHAPVEESMDATLGQENAGNNVMNIHERTDQEPMSISSEDL